MTNTQNRTSTTDILFQGRLKILQKEKGYRFSVDSPILAHHIHLKDTDKAVDLGTGCGIIPIIVSHRNPSAQLMGIEIQKDLADLAARNVRLNHMADRIAIVHADMKNVETYAGPEVMDVVFSNPPYRELLSGRISPQPERAVARHEIKACLSDVTCAAERLLKPSGRLVVIYPAERTVDLLARMRASKLEPKRIRLVYTKQYADAELILAEAVKYGRPGVTFAPPLNILGTDGSRTDEYKEIIGK